MATEPKTTGLTYDDLQAFPDDNLRRELIGGELIVTPSPSTGHQQAVMVVSARLFSWCEQHGGRVFPAPLDVYFSQVDVVEPDVLFVGPENIAKVEKKFIRSAPDLVVEVSSPSTRRLEIVRKKELYEREGVLEYWYVDLEAERVEVYRLAGGLYGAPVLLGRGEMLETPLAPGVSIAIDEVLGPRED